MNLDMQNVCRTCLRPNNLVDLFPENLADGEREASETVREHVKVCYDIEIRANDKNSRKICRECIRLLSLFSSSRTYAKAADHHMTSINSSLCFAPYSSTMESSLAAVKSIVPPVVPVTLASSTEAPTEISNASVPVAITEAVSTNNKRKKEADDRKSIGTTIDKSNILEPAAKREKRPEKKPKATAKTLPVSKLKERQKKLKKILENNQKKLKLKSAKQALLSEPTDVNHTNGVKMPKKRGRRPKLRGKKKLKLSGEGGSVPVVVPEGPTQPKLKGNKKVKLSGEGINDAKDIFSSSRSGTPVSNDTAPHMSESESLSEESEKRASSGRILKPVDRMEL